MAKRAHTTLKKFIENLPDSYLICRARTYHTLGAFTVDEDVKLGVSVYRETEVCAHCRTKRTRCINKRNGMLVGEARYDHPAGYTAVGFGFRTKEEIGLFRLERARRHLRRVS